MLATRIDDRAGILGIQDGVGGQFFKQVINAVYLFFRTWRRPMAIIEISYVLKQEIAKILLSLEGGFEGFEILFKIIMRKPMVPPYNSFFNRHRINHELMIAQPQRPI